jgi:ketosteroid isomerase-like protein
VAEAHDRAEADVLSLNKRATAAWETANWEAYAAVMTDDIVVVDHRPASLGTVEGREAYIAATRVLREMLSDVTNSTVTQYRVHPRGSVAQTLVRGDADGSDFEIAFIALNTIRDGAMDRMELYPVEELDTALARFDELIGRAATAS